MGLQLCMYTAPYLAVRHRLRLSFVLQLPASVLLLLVPEKSKGCHRCCSVCRLYKTQYPDSSSTERVRAGVKVSIAARLYWPPGARLLGRFYGALQVPDWAHWDFKLARDVSRGSWERGSCPVGQATACFLWCPSSSTCPINIEWQSSECMPSSGWFGNDLPIWEQRPQLATGWRVTAGHCNTVSILMTYICGNNEHKHGLTLMKLKSTCTYMVKRN